MELENELNVVRGAENYKGGIDMSRLTEREEYDFIHDRKGKAFVYGGIDFRGDSYDGEVIDKLAHYEDLEEQGLLLRLPCPLGTPVYYVQNCLAPNCKECGGFARVDNCYTEHKSRIFEQEFGYRHLKAFGKSVFLTKEEAEAALEKMKGEEHE